MTFSKNQNLVCFQTVSKMAQKTQKYTYLIAVSGKLADVLHVVLPNLRQMHHQVGLRRSGVGSRQGPLARIEMLAPFDIVKRRYLHIPEQRHNLDVLPTKTTPTQPPGPSRERKPNTNLEYPVDSVQPQLLLLVELVDVAQLVVHEEQAEPHDFDEHVLFAGGQVHFGLVHVHADVDHVGQQVLVAGYLFQVLFDGVADFVLGRQEHGQVLGLLEGLGVGHYFQELGGPENWP